jgi:hypothetical protein
LAIVADRDSREVMSVMRRTKAGLNIKDTPAPLVIDVKATEVAA